LTETNENSRCSARFHFDVPGVISSFGIDHGCGLRGHVEDGVVDVTAGLVDLQWHGSFVTEERRF
jgi:hypothetical protein